MRTEAHQLLDHLHPEDMLVLGCEALARVPGLTMPQLDRIRRAIELETDLPEDDLAETGAHVPALPRPLLRS